MPLILTEMYFESQTFRSENDDVIENGNISKRLSDTSRMSSIARLIIY